MKTQAEYEEHLKAKSLILAFDPENPHKDCGPNKPPRSLTLIDLSEKGAENELRRINGTDRRPGELDAARQRVKDTLAEIEHAKEISGQGDAFKVPKDRQELINRQRAVVRVLEAESRHLHSIQKYWREQRESRPVPDRVRRARELSGKRKDGVLVEFAGRVVYQDEKGESRFQDDGTLVSDHIARVQAERKAAAKAKREHETHISKQLDELRAQL